MPLPFDLVCNLLELLESYELRDPPFLPAQKEARITSAITSWFKSNQGQIHRSDTDAVALLSCLFPERRTDRVYGIQEATLVRFIGRSLAFGTQRLATLKAWKPSSRCDLAALIGQLQQVYDAGLPKHNVTIDEVDKTLGRLAARCRFSSPEVRSKFRDNEHTLPSDILCPLIQMLPSRNLKWFIRMILKRLGYVELDEQLVFYSYHFLLPAILKVHSTFHAAINILRIPNIAAFPPHSGSAEEKAFRTVIAPYVRPQVGVKVGRPQFLKARSIKDCLRMTSSGSWCIEYKYDGEYCQIHVDLSRGADCVQIFSKSGKDSTQDRFRLHKPIRMSLGIGHETCTVRSKCILEGELVVWSDKEKSILDFHKIRKYVRRSGGCIGTEQDSQTYPHERLMIIYYDALLIDEDNLLSKPYEERRRCLKKIIKKYPGYAVTSQWGKLQSSNNKERAIKECFATAIAARAEGLVLKHCDGPYISLNGPGDENLGCIIKLKKDYIPGLGDTADFAIIGARFDISTAQKLGIRTLKWTDFTFACLVNKEEAVRYHARPVYRPMGIVSPASQCISRENVIELCRRGYFLSEDFDPDKGPSTFDLHPDSLHAKFDVIFKEPFIVEVLGSGFDKPSSSKHWMLRHPRVIKLNFDRTLDDVVSFDELQEMAENAKNTPEDSELEKAEWLQKLHDVDAPKHDQHSSDRSTSPYATTNSMPSSPRGETSVPMIRVDTSEMLPGEAQYVPLETPSPSRHRHLSENIQIDPLLNPPKPSTNVTSSIERANNSMEPTSCNVPAVKQTTDDLKDTCTPKKFTELPLKLLLTQNTAPMTPKPDVKVHASQQLQIMSNDQLLDLMTDAVIYLPSFLQSYEYFSRTMWRSPVFEGLNTAFITNLDYWIRELNRNLGPLDPEVEESQAYPNCQKTLLVESLDRPRTLREIHRVAEAVILAVGETIEVWNWHVLTSDAFSPIHLHNSGRKPNPGLNRMKLGEICFDDETLTNIFEQH